MAPVGPSPEGVSFTHLPQGAWKNACSPARSQPQPGKENEPPASAGSGALSRSKIPVLSRSRLPPDLQLLHQRGESQPQKKAAGEKPCTETCPVSLTCRGDKYHAVPCAHPAAAAEPLVRPPKPRSRSHPRGPLEEIQPGAAVRRNTPGNSGPSGREVGPVEFVADQVGLANSRLGLAQEPMLARSAPLRGRRGNAAQASGNAQTAQGSGSRHMASGTLSLGPDPSRTSCYSRVAAKGTADWATQDPAQHHGLTLKPQQVQALSVMLRDLAPCDQPVSLGTGTKEACWGHPHPIATATPSGPARSQEAGSTTGDQSANSRLGSPSDGQAAEPGQGAAHSGGSPTRDPMGASQTEHFVPDPAALASILSNVGLSHTSTAPRGKFGLARRVPVKGLQDLPPHLSRSTMDGRISLLGARGSIPPKGRFSRMSCRSVLGLKGIEAPDGLRAARSKTPEISRDSPFGSARRVPVTQPQSLHRTGLSAHRLPLFPRTPRCAQVALQSPARWAGGLSPQPRSSDLEESALPWEKIAVRLFGPGESQAAAEASVRSVLGQPGEGHSKAQRIQVLSQLLRKEVEGAAGNSHLDELHGLLAACAPRPSPAAGAGPKPLPKPGLGPAGGAAAPPSSTTFPGAGTTLTFSSQRPVCASPLIRSLKSPAASPGAAGAGTPLPAPSSRAALVKQRMEELLSAHQRFQESCLDDECAFYTSRAPSSQACAPHRCTDPTARLLEAQEAMYFIPISQPGPSATPGEAESSLQPWR
ncbi:tastin [Carettochelys insculpta]|uniref:tastin n=1 Tax=Carettochelys insculpta TaxID=44489 RepID=UPI003EBE78FF